MDASPHLFNPVRLSILSLNVTSPIFITDRQKETFKEKDLGMNGGELRFGLNSKLSFLVASDA